MSRTNNKVAANGNTQRGFTLIELMVVVAIVTILVAIGIPSYRQHVVKSNRSAAEGFIAQAANKEEQVMLDLRSYVVVGLPGNAASVNNPLFVTTPPTGIGLAVPDGVSTNYNLYIQVPNPNTPTIAATYLISAAAVGPQQAQDTQCPTLTMDQTGAKAPAGCW